MSTANQPDDTQTTRELTSLICIISSDVCKVERQVYVREWLGRDCHVAEIARCNTLVRLKIIDLRTQMLERKREEIALGVYLESGVGRKWEVCWGPREACRDWRFEGTCGVGERYGVI
jgi:hypothetical protein